MSVNSKWLEMLHEVREKSKGTNPTPLLCREFKSVSGSASGATSQETKNHSPDDVAEGSIRIMQWNLLAQGLCQTSDSFILCPHEALDWNFRQHHILEELLSYRSAVYCLQEVDHFDFIKTCLGELGFHGLFFPKPDSPCLYEANNNGPDGCAMFWDTALLELVSHDSLVLKRQCGRKTNQVAIVCRFKFLTGSAQGKEFMCATTHLKAKKHHAELRTQQGKDLERLLREKASDVPLVLCGDFNADPDEAVVESMKASELKLFSAYTLLSPTQEEPPFTTWKVRGGRKGHEESSHTIDYFFYSKDKFQCERILEMPEAQLLRPNFLPSYAYPSDHLSLVVELKLSG